MPIGLEVPILVIVEGILTVFKSGQLRKANSWILVTVYVLSPYVTVLGIVIAPEYALKYEAELPPYVLCNLLVTVAVFPSR